MSARIAERINKRSEYELIVPHTMPRSLYMRTEHNPHGVDIEIWQNKDFWQRVFDERIRAGKNIHLSSFNLFEWFPRNPGLFHLEDSQWKRDAAQHNIASITEANYEKYQQAADAPPDHAELFRAATATDSTARELVYSPRGKVLMLEGGIGCIRLKPVEFDVGGKYWWMSASSSEAPDSGIPIALPDHLYQQIIDDLTINGFVGVDLTGTLEFVPDRYSDIYGSERGLPRLYIKVDSLRRTETLIQFGLVSVAASFVSEYTGQPSIYATYVTFEPGTRNARKNAATWLKEEYVEGMYDGWILTDFDQQMPAFSEAIFSLDQVLSSPDLALMIQNLRSLYGRFDWSMLEKQSINFEKNAGDVIVKDNRGVISGVAIAQGKNSKAEAISLNTSQVLENADFAELAKAFAEFRSKLNEEKDSASLDIIKGAVAKAEVAASENDRDGVAKALNELKPFGSKVLELCEKIGVGVATAALKSTLGL